MKITKLGHCCMLVDEAGTRFLTDPGMFTREQHEQLTGVDAVLITHEHQDHFHAASLGVILKHNPTARVFCNGVVGRILGQESIPHEIIEDGESAEVKGVRIEGFGAAHAIVHPMLPQGENTGFLIAGRLWYPGDAFPKMTGKPDIIALPIVGPWMKLSEAIDYALSLKPTVCFPVHDFILTDIGRGIHERLATAILEPRGTRFLPVELNKEYEL